MFLRDHLVLQCDLTWRVFSVEQEQNREGHDVHVGLDDDSIISRATSEDTDDGKVVHIGVTHGLVGLTG